MYFIFGSGAKHLESDIVGDNNIYKTIDSEVKYFPDSEIEVILKPSLDQKVAIDVDNNIAIYIIQSMGGEVNGKLIELLFLFNAAKKLGAKNIHLVIPYLGYARSDSYEVKSDFKHVKSFGFSVIANILDNLGASSITLFELHNTELLNLFKKTIIRYVDFNEVFANSVDIIETGNLFFAAPDIGGASRVEKWAKKWSIDYVVMSKKRLANGECETIFESSNNMYGTYIICDDMIDTGNTILNAAKALKERGVSNVLVLAVHGVFSNDVFEYISSGYVDKVIITDSIYHDSFSFKCFVDIEKIEVLPLSIKDFILNE